MTSAQLYTSTGSDSAVSGQFFMISDLERKIDMYENALDDALEETLSVEKQFLSNTLSNHPDWADKADNANVSLTNDGFQYSVNHDDAQDLEYGNPARNVVATGVLRSTAKRRSYDLGNEFYSRVAERLS